MDARNLINAKRNPEDARNLINAKRNPEDLRSQINMKRDQLIADEPDARMNLIKIRSRQ